jgi:xanthine dehydrogenase accessory factor
MRQALLTRLNAARTAREAVVHVIDFTAGESHVIAEGEAVDGVLGAAVSVAFRSGKAGIVEADGRSFFLNPYLPPVRIVAIGAVHISQALAAMAMLAGFDIRIIDPRTAFATPERFAGFELIADWPADVLQDHPLDRYSALVALTHDPRIDDHPIGAALKAGCFYVGALGSRKTHAKRLERLANDGVTEADLARIHAPVGFDIGAASPAEIAVSILAEIIQALRRPEDAAQGRRGP